MRPSSSLLLATLVALPLRIVMAQEAQRGFAFERAGRYADAVTAYFMMLQGEPANSGALLGLERTLPRLGRLPELLPVVARALAAAPASDVVRGLRVRTYVSLGFGDSAEAFVRTWAAAASNDAQPYRELGLAYADAGRLTDARRVLLAGRRVLGQPEALAVELAELAERTSMWEVAAREWALAATATPAYVLTAADRLREAPDDHRTAVLAAVVAAGSVPGRRLGAELLLAWGDPEQAWAMFGSTLDEASPLLPRDLRAFAQRAGGTGTREGRRVQGLALERFAELVPEPLAARARADAARALLDAGDAVAARRVLAALTGDGAAPAEVRAAAEGQLVRSLIVAGELETASRRLDASEPGLARDEAAALRLELAEAWLARGDLQAADAALAADSSVDAAALRGWVALYRGDLQGASALLLSAGPYAGRPGDATRRSAMLALLASVGVASAPDLGGALLLLARHDSAAAVAALAAAARGLAVDGGQPEVLLLAGQVAGGLGGPGDSTAAALFAEVVHSGSDGAAPPAAELDWARLLVRQGRTADAIARLEHLILSYPESATVPQARRELEQARGAIPRS